MAKTINTLIAFPFPSFFGTKSLHHRLKLRKRFVGWNWPCWGAVLSHPSLVQSTLWSVYKDSPVAKTFNTLTSFPFSFFRDQVFASQIKTKEEICYVKLKSLRVSSQLPISHTKSTLCSVHKDSPVAETFNTLTSFPFPLFCKTSLCITDLNQEGD